MTAARLEVERLKTEWMNQGVSQGAKEMAEAVLMALEARGLLVDDMSRQRILACQDMPTLKRWIVKAVIAPRIEDVLT